MGFDAKSPPNLPRSQNGCGKHQGRHRAELAASTPYIGGRGNLLEIEQTWKLLLQIGVPVQAVFVKSEQKAGFLISDAAFADGSFHVAAELLE